MSSAVKVIAELRRMTNSRMGNPRFMVTFDDRTRALTAPDSSVAQQMRDEAILGRTLSVTFDGHGRIIHAVPYTPKGGPRAPRA